MNKKQTYKIWKGTIAEYKALHWRINKEWGKANECENCATEEGLIDWANISGEYHEEREDWKQLCRRCHQKEDGRDKGGFFVGHTHTEESKKKTSKAMKAHWAKHRQERMAVILRGTNHPSYKHGLYMKETS